MKKISNNKKNRNPYLLYHIAIGVATCILLVGIIHWHKGFFRGAFHEGDIALQSIYAPYDFSIKGELNSIATEEARQKARDSVLSVYVFDRGQRDIVLNKAKSIIDSDEFIVRLSDIKDIQEFSDNVKVIIEKFMSRYIISASTQAVFEQNNLEKITVVDSLDGTESVIHIDECFTLQDLKKDLKDFSSSVIKNRKEREIALGIIGEILTINLTHSKEMTESKKQLAVNKVESIYNIIEVKKNEMIVNKGERIRKEHIAKLQGIGKKQPPSIKMASVFAIVLLVCLFILLTFFYIKFFQPTLLSGNKELALLAIICVLILAAAKTIVVSPWPSTFIPLAVASMLIAILIDSRLAIVVTCFLSILVGMVSGNRLDIAGMSLIGGIVGAFAIRGVRRRSQVIEAGLGVGFANMSYLIAMGLIRNLDFNTYITESLFGLGNGLLSAVIVTGILPIFENGFKVTTDISLLELADLNHPLLKEMVIKAPGTYHHSLVVGNLAEAVCEAIGANPLLARVSSYFHDIGKIEKASYFSENQPVDESLHDKLSPTMSSLIITNHVKNGVELAHKYQLNKKIIDIIKEHHGTGLVFYFFKRALEKVQDEDIGEQSFRYPGPKPQTKEAACVLLADSVEAASRALDDPTASRIKGLVRKIINNKFIDGQLDECDLTLKNLEKIAEVFTHILTGIFHTRVEYPEEPEKIEKS